MRTAPHHRSLARGLAALLILAGLPGGTVSAEHLPVAAPTAIRTGSGTVPLDHGLRVLFVGNSYTHRGPVPDLVRDLAVAGGWLEPDVTCVAPGGKSLAFHRESPDTLAAIDEGDWDVVVLQEYSTRPTSAGDPRGFHRDVAWFGDRIARASPGARIVLFETWARHPDHELYRHHFDGRHEMQAQLRRHYRRAADRLGATVAWVGDAWESALDRNPSARLHDRDRHHAGPRGQLLAAMVLFDAIFQQTPPELLRHGRRHRTVRWLQEAARSVSWQDAGPVDSAEGSRQEFVWSLSTATPLASSSSSPVPFAPSTGAGSIATASSRPRSLAP